MNAHRLLAQYEKIADAPNAIPRLRRFILDMAVRGKLVPQDPNDEPASELLKRIGVEKARLVKAKLIKRPKQLESVEHDDTEFCIPSSWCWTRLGEVTSYTQRGKSPKYASADGSPVVSQKCVQWHGLDLDKAWKITYQSLVTYEDIRFLREGDLLWNSTGTGTIGRIIRLIDPPEKLVCDSHVTVVRCLFVSSEYIRTWLRTGNVYGLIEERAAGSTNQVELTAQMALNQVVPLPPLAEQHRIVAKVDELMALCDRLAAARTERETRRDRLAAASLARLNAPDPDLAVFQDQAAFALDNLTQLITRADQIKALRQTILNLAVRGKLVEQDPNDETASELLKRRKIAVSSAGPFELPASWAWVNVGAVAVARLGKMLDKAKNKGTPRKYLRNINVRWFDFDLSDLLEMRFEDSELPEFTLQFGDVLICEGGEPGRAAVWDGREDDIYFQKAIHRIRFLNIVDSSFFVKALRASADDGRLAEYFTGTGIKHFTGKGLAGYLFPLPPLPEQHRIVVKVDELMALCDRLEASLTSGDDTRRRLLDALLHEALAPSEEVSGNIISTIAEKKCQPNRPDHRKC